MPIGLVTTMAVVALGVLRLRLRPPVPDASRRARSLALAARPASPVIRPRSGARYVLCRIGDTVGVVLRAYAQNLDRACALTSVGTISRRSAGGAAERPVWLAMALP